MSKKEELFKERFKQALDSTYKVISEEIDNLGKKNKQEDIEDYKISNLYSREDYIKFRAYTDSNALKKRFFFIPGYFKLPNSSHLRNSI